MIFGAFSAEQENLIMKHLNQLQNSFKRWVKCENQFGLNLFSIHAVKSHFTCILRDKSDILMTQRDFIIARRYFQISCKGMMKTRSDQMQRRRKRFFSYRRLDFKWTSVDCRTDPGILYCLYHSFFLLL